MTGSDLAVYAAGFLVVAWFSGYAWGFAHRFVRRILNKATS